MIRDKYKHEEAVNLLRSGIRQNSRPMEIRISGEIHYGDSGLYLLHVAQNQ